MDTQTLSEVNVNLLVFSRYLSGNRLYVRGRRFFSEHVWIFTGFKRMVLGDSRFSLIEPLRGLVARTEYFRNCSNISAEHKSQLVHNLKDALAGVGRLYHDYEGDTRMESELEEIIQSIKNIIKSNNSGIDV